MTARPGLAERIDARLSPSVKQMIADAREQRAARIRFTDTRAARILTFAVVSVPVAWLLGVGEFIWPVLVLPMALFVSTRIKVAIPRAFLLWIAFLGLVIVAAIGAGAGVHMVGVYLSATIIFLFAYNTSADELPDGLIVALVAFYWLVLVAGGLLGLLFGTTEFPSLGNALLVDAAREGSWWDEVTLVQFSDPERTGVLFSHRPKGFMPYANHWGSALVMFLPAAGLLRLRLRAGPAARFLTFAALVAIVPFVISRNRWAWLSLLILLGYFIVRMWALRPAMARTLLAGVTALFLVLTVTPLRDVVVDRFEGESSNEFRSEQYRLSWDLIQTSPWLGFGVNQESEEPALVAGGEVEGLSLGADSQILQTMINHGLPALGLLALWLVTLIARTRRISSPAMMLAHLGAIVAFIHAPFYILVPHRWMFLMLLAGAGFRQLRIEGRERSITLWSRQTALEAKVRRRRRRDRFTRLEEAAAEDERLPLQD